MRVTMPFSSALHAVGARFRLKGDAGDENYDSEVSDGDLKYVGNKGGNYSNTSYQEASGAPVEVSSPLGYSVGAVTIIFLNINKMIGTGIFSTRKWATYL